MVYDAVVDKARLDGAMAATADAIREKTGGAEALTWDLDTGFRDGVNAIQTGGGVTAMLDRSVVTISDDKATIIEQYALRRCPALRTLDVPNVTDIGQYAVYDCAELRTINLKSVKTLGDSAFYGCVRLTDPTFPALESTGSSALRDCGDSSDVAGMTKVVMPELTTLGNSTFYTCAKLQRVELPKVTSIGTYAFYACSNLKVLVLGDTVPTLADVNAFANSAIKTNGTGYIYVPDAKVDEYKAATNWSSLADRIKPRSEVPA